MVVFSGFERTWKYHFMDGLMEPWKGERLRCWAKIHRVCGWFGEVPKFADIPEKIICANLEYKSGSRWSRWHVTEDTLTNMFELGEFLANWPIQESQFGWHFMLRCLKVFVAPLVPCPSNLSFNRWPMFHMKGNPSHIGGLFRHCTTS